MERRNKLIWFGMWVVIFLTTLTFAGMQILNQHSKNGDLSAKLAVISPKAKALAQKVQGPVTKVILDRLDQKIEEQDVTMEKYFQHRTDEKLSAALVRVYYSQVEELRPLIAALNPAVKEEYEQIQSHLVNLFKNIPMNSLRQSWGQVQVAFHGTLKRFHGYSRATVRVSMADSTLHLHLTGSGRSIEDATEEDKWQATRMWLEQLAAFRLNQPNTKN